MGKKKEVVEGEAVEKLAFQITYMQGEEEIHLSYDDAERRDHEAERLRIAGYNVSRVDA